MKRFNSLRPLRLLAAMAVIAAVAAGCVTVDDTMGSNLTPNDQQFKAGYMTLPRTGELNPRKYVETRLYQTDSLRMSQLAYGYIGSQLNDTTGLCHAGFLSQFISYYRVDKGEFGYRPFLDSVVLLLSVGKYGNDTLTPQRFHIYEVTSNDYLTQKPLAPGASERDTAFYMNFDPTPYVSSEPLFSFTFPDGEKTGPATKSVTLDVEPAGKEFVRRLFLEEGEKKGDYSVYEVDNLSDWFATFKGIYIAPAEEQTEAGKGNIYALTLESSGFAVYGRNRAEHDPTLIQDTVGMAFYFYEAEADAGNVSVNVVRHDYAKATSAAAIDLQSAVETNEDRPENGTLYVDAMGGVLSEITFTQEFFDELEAEITAANQKTGQQFRSLAFSQVMMEIYFPGSDYDWEHLPDTEHLIYRMDAAPERLGLYSDFKHLTGISDYAYYYEANYDNVKLAYDGRINRSHGCYSMNVTGYMQQLWTQYMEAKEANGGVADLDAVPLRTIYLGQEAYNLLGQRFTLLQGQADGQNNAPIRFSVAYTLVR